MKNLIVLVIIFTTMSCKKEITFIALKKHVETGVYDRDDERKGKKYVYQSAIVVDFPEKKEELEPLLLNYHNKSIDSIFQDEKVINFLTTFYVKNNKTSYFIENADDPGGFSSEILIDYYEEFGIAEIKTKRLSNSKELETEVSFVN